jgi:lipopolysaccharide export system permease protein
LVVFLSIGLSCKSRKNVLLVSLILCVGAAVAFYVFQMITMYLAKFGYIPPVSGGWTPVVLFTIISVVLMKFAKT